LFGIDTAHGHSVRVIEACARNQAAHTGTDLIAGNVGTFEGAQEFG